MSESLAVQGEPSLGGSQPVRTRAAFSVRQVEAVGRTMIALMLLAYVTANADFVGGVNLAPFRYALAVVLGGVALALRPLSAFRAAAILSPVFAVYALAGMPLYAAMVLVFSAMAPLCVSGLQSVVRERRWGFVAMLIALVSLPFFGSFGSVFRDGLFSTRYGRPRMLLGFSHPKEASVAISVPLMLGLLLLRDRRRAMQLALAGVVLTVVVGSRNVALTLLVGSALAFFPLAVMLVAGIGSLSTVIWVTLDPSWFARLDALSSFRLSLWINTLDRVNEVRVVLPGLANRFGADSFFVEVVVLVGLGGLVVILLWLAALLAGASSSGEFGKWPVVAVLMLGLFAFFDSGIASTGSMMHLLLWSLVLAPYIQRSQRSPEQR